MRVKMISGPVSACTFDVPAEAATGDVQPLRLYVFGDAHFSYEHACPEPCDEAHGCLPVVRFVRGAADAARRRGATLDVFLELVYVAAANKGARERRARDAILGYQRDLFAADRGPGRRQPPGTSKIGIIKLLHDEFAAELYDESLKRRRMGRSRSVAAEDEGGLGLGGGGGEAKGAGSLVRVHYGDARNEPRTLALMLNDPTWDVATLRRLYPSSAALGRTMQAIMFARDFDADVRRALGPRVADALRRLVQACEARPHAVAKQFHALREGPVKDALRRFGRDRIAAAVAALRVAGFDAPDVVDASSGDKVDAAMRGDVGVLLMDFYVLCRFARFCVQRRAPPGSPGGAGAAAVLYAGHLHAVNYIDFFSRYLRLAPLQQHRAVYLPEHDDFVRCVHLRSTSTHPF
jgi:hypothetical protein